MDGFVPSVWAILAVAVSTFLIGGLWYSPLLFAKPWQRYVGLSDEELGKGALRAFGGSFVCALIASANLAFFLGDATVGFGVAAGFATGFGWVATGLTTTFLFERRPFGLIAIDAGYHVVTFTLAGLIFGAWPY